MQNPTLQHELNNIHLAELREIAAKNRINNASKEAHGNAVTRLVTLFKRPESKKASTDVLTTQELRTLKIIR